MPLTLSCAFATSPSTPQHVALAEQLGYRRAWLYDSPALYPDVWVTLALAAQRTSTIELGPGVLVPGLRHPMVNAAALAQLADLAPGRTVAAVGAGFTGRMTLGQRPLPWAFVREYVSVLRGLLEGRTVEWEGAAIRMLHPEGFAPARPVRVPILIGADGPRGDQVARDLGDGVLTTTPRPGWSWQGILTFGTVLAPGEDPGGQRVLDAAGHAAAVALHAFVERGVDLQLLPGAAAWYERLCAEVPAAERHLALHEGHLVGLSERDRAVVDGTLVSLVGAARTEQQWRDHLALLEASGASEVVYQPAGPDIPGELERFAALTTWAATA